MSIIERLKRESEARIEAMYKEKEQDKKVEDKTFGRDEEDPWWGIMNGVTC